MRIFWVISLMLGLAGCATVPQGPAPTPQTIPQTGRAVTTEPTRQKAMMFVQVAKAVEPVAEFECRRQSQHRNCNFRIVVDDRLDQPANAFQFLTPSGRPVLAFNYALINMVDNASEMAFVMSHEAAHHIAGHLQLQEASARQGQQILTQIATLSGASSEDVADAAKLGAVLGALQYSKDFELEADRLGTIITHRAGFDPLLGAQFFYKVRDPGDRLLGTHPPNRDRINVVRRTVAGL